MAPIAALPFESVITQFAEAVASNFRQPIQAQPEDQLKSPVAELLRATGELTGLTVTWRTEVRPYDVRGRPDIGVLTNGLLTGHVELKRPGLGARPETFRGENRKQWKRFQALPNLIYTDGSEWSLYRTGELRHRVRIAYDVSVGGAKSVDREALEAVGELFRDFLYWEPVVPGTARGLAEYLAPLTKILREDTQKALEMEDGPLPSLAKEWQGLLFPEGSEAQFADAYAQTVTYALLLARFEGAESLRPLMAVDTLQREHGLLAEALQLLEAKPVRDELMMPIELLERAIGAVDSAKISGGGDPWLYFYEEFLGAYDPKLRKERGVYYTPVEVVRTQVRLTGELLRTRFKKKLAFAESDVAVLDPAVGTGTYPLAVLDHVEQTVGDRYGPGAVPGRLHGLADRLYGFEILVGPYSVAHLRLSQRLKEAGVTDKTPRVYLTDTLESPNGLPEFTTTLLQVQLTKERTRAQEVKKETRVFVCLGNPPYDREERTSQDDYTGRRKGGWVRYGDDEQDAPDPILEDFLSPVRKAGQGGHLKNLYNDYVYFWRWALWKVFDSTEDAGIVTFITASSYLRGPGFAGMRRKMREVFDELWIIDLEGDRLAARKTENVFAIQTPVAIAIGVRDGPPRPDTPAKVWKAQVTGTQREKLASLDSAAGLADFPWRECSQEWDAPFYPGGTGSYFEWPPVTDLFPWQHSGAQLKRTWPIGETKEVLTDRWSRFLGGSHQERQIAFRETRDRSIGKRYPNLLDPHLRLPAIATLCPGGSLPPIRRYSFRTFDRHWVLADSRVGDFMRPELWRAHEDKQVYLTSLLTEVLGSGPAAVAAASIPDLHHFRGSFGGKHAIPLWRDAQATQPNVTKGLLQTMGATLGITITPESLFAYVYGILAQPAYTKRFWEELELPPPRLPITKDGVLFQRVAEHGARLLYLHTYGERFSDPDVSNSELQGTARCTKSVPFEEYPTTFSYDSDHLILRIGSGEFSPVTPAVWEYAVSGLQVVKSWLDYRKLERSGRKSSPLDEIRPARWDFTEELLELLWVLEHTIELQPEGAALLEEVCSSALVSDDELPKPTPEEREPPGTASKRGDQSSLLSSTTD